MGIKITTILKDRYLWSIVALLLFGTALVYGADIYIRNAAPSEQPEYGLLLIVLSVQSVTWLLTTVVTTWRFKFRGGLVITLVIGLILTPRIAEELAHPLGPGMLSLYLIGGSFAIGFSWLVDRWKRTRQALELAYTEIKRAQENLHYYLHEITRAQEEERKRISRELHDSPTQTLIALLRQLEDFINEEVKSPSKENKVLWSFHERIRGVVRELRHFSMELRPPVLDDLGLIPALEWMTGELINGYGIKARLEMSGNERRLSSEAELLLFRIIQEALHNIAKHSQASMVNIEVKFLENKLAFTISDDGIGFEVPSKLEDLPRTGMLGLVGIQERVKLLGGKLKLESELSKGTTISIEVPDLT